MASRPEIFAVVLAGGSGTRFWPASRRMRPKQLLPLGPSAPETLIASTVKRLEGLVDQSHIFVSTGEHLVEQTKRELPQLPNAAYLAEPFAKNTAPCIAWSAAVVAEKNPDAVVCVLPSDQYASDSVGFCEELSTAALVASQGAITTIGIVPTRPETGYGYIQRGGATEDGSFLVERFVEKPDLSTAQSYLESGDYFWNAGIFVFRARDMLSAVERHMPDLFEALQELEQASSGSLTGDQEAIRRFFSSCPAISIDYGVMEKQTGLRVVAGDFGWSDLGSWESAWELSAHDGEGNTAPSNTILVDAKNNLVENLSASKEGKVIALVGVSDLCVVETDDALLVMPRERSQDVRKVVQELKEQQRDELI